MAEKNNIYTDAPKPKRALQIGDEVMIYERPLTFEKPEGLAILQRKLRSRKPGLERWAVRFRGKGVETFERSISADTEVNIF